MMTAADPAARAADLLAAGHAAEAIALVAAAAEHGDAGALFQQGVWRLIGSPLPRNLPLARRDLDRAALAGHVDARRFKLALTANGSGGPADWAAACMLLERYARQEPTLAAQHKLLAGMTLNEAGAPTALPDYELLTPDGLVRRFPALLTAAECAHVASAARDLLAPAMVADPRTGQLVPHPVRTSDAAQLGPTREDLVIRAINHRLAAASGTLIDQGEALTVLRYQPGQQFRLHSDALPGTRNQRVATVLVYLNDGYGGGATTFPDYGLRIEPRGGDAIIFRNVDAAGRPEPRARHAGEPVTRGTKWLATRWIRARPFDVWRGPEAT